ncbi:MAG: hypothetical protein IKN80_00600 [Clostridiales bacterium]|nr:hypothetical protein [Clostridiales bacterium]
MKVNLKKMTASAVCLAMTASFASCAMFDKDDDAVLEVAEDYAAAVAKIKVSDICELLVDGDDLEEDLTAYVDPSADTSNEDYDAICGAIEGTLSYEIDADSVESSKKDAKASVNVVYTIVDYQAVYDDVIADGGDLDAFVDALGSGDTKEIEQTINLVYEDNTWLVKDKNGKNLYDVYAFYDDAFDFEFAPSISPDLIEEIVWWGSNDGVYTDPYTIELDIIPTEEGQAIEWQFTYEYYLDGTLIFTSDECSDQGYYIESYYGEDYDSQAQVNDEGCLVAGQYRCVVYDLAGNVLADDTCTVQEDSSVSVVDVVPDGSDVVDNDTWDEGVYTYWYTYSPSASSASMETGEYGTDEDTIEFTCQVLDEDNLANYPVYYEVYYSADGDQYDAEMVHSGTITPSEYTNGYFYEFQYVQNGGLDAGTYWLIGASDSNGTVIYFTAEATVS